MVLNIEALRPLVHKMARKQKEGNRRQKARTNQTEQLSMTQTTKTTSGENSKKYYLPTIQKTKTACGGESTSSWKPTNDSERPSTESPSYGTVNKTFNIPYACD